MCEPHKRPSQSSPEKSPTDTHSTHRHPLRHKAMMSMLAVLAVGGAMAAPTPSGWAQFQNMNDCGTTPPPPIQRVGVCSAIRLKTPACAACVVVRTQSWLPPPLPHSLRPSLCVHRSCWRKGHNDICVVWPHGAWFSIVPSLLLPLLCVPLTCDFVSVCVSDASPNSSTHLPLTPRR